jgi:antitoxin ChpS
MAVATLRTLGGSVVMTIPKAILEQARLRAGAQVEIDYRGGRLIVEPLAKPKYSLSELLAKSSAASLAPARADAAWLQDGPVGEELL